jgi:transposase-like protein
MIKCPHCQSTTDQVKAGKTRTGSQRYKCRSCNRRYTPEPKQQGYPDELRQQAMQLYVDGMSLRRIGRHLGIDHKTVSHWVNAYAAQLLDAPVPSDINNAEMDELFTFVGSKKHSLRDDCGGSHD